MVDRPIEMKLATYNYPYHSIEIVAVYLNEDDYDNEVVSHYKAYEKNNLLSDDVFILEFPTYEQVREWFVDITFS